MIDRQGEHIDNYRLIYLLGSGQFGEVYLAEPTTDSQNLLLVAIKVLRPVTPDNQRELSYFLKEIRVARLKHKNIVQVYDFGLDQDIPFIVMEYAPNGTLSKRHPKGTLVPLPTIISYVKQVANALQYIHDKRFIHRDVKPANMLIGENGQILLSDFGIATLSHSTFSQSQQEMAGTIPYIAPEQIKGWPRPASDQYSLGVVVYEWLCGSCPFQGKLDEIMRKHQTEPPPPLRTKIPTISPDVEAVVMRALAKDPKQRFDNILDFAWALEQANPSVSEQPTVSLPNPRPPDITPPKGSIDGSTKPRISRRTVVRGCIIAGAVAAAGGLVWLIPHVYEGKPTLTSSPPPTPSPTPLPRIPLGKVINTYQGHSGYVVNAAAWSPDSKRIASGSDDKTVQVWNAVDGSSPYTYNGHTRLVDAVAWSPDGLHIASGSFDQTVQVWSAVNGSSLYTYKGHYPNAVDTVAWSPDSKRIASGSLDQTVQVWNATDGSSPYTYRGHTAAVRAVAWSPDSKRIASGSYDQTVQVWNATDGSSPYTYRGHLTYNGSSPPLVEAVAWSPDGKYIASGGNDQTVQVWDATNGSLVYTYKGHSGYPVNAVAWSPDGKHIASGGVDKTVQIWNAVNGNHLFTYSGHSDEVKAVAWSPDGRLIASGGGDHTVHVWGTG